MVFEWLGKNALWVGGLALAGWIATSMIGRVGDVELKKNFTAMIKRTPKQGLREAQTSVQSETIEHRDAAAIRTLLLEVRSEVEMNGATFSDQELGFYLKQAMEPLRPHLYTKYAKDVSIPSPPTEPLNSEEEALAQKTRLPYRCQKESGETIYPAHLPSNNEGIGKCWVRVFTHRKYDMIMIGGSGWGTKTWTMRYWHPNNKRWSRYTQNDELRMLEYYADQTLGFEEEDKDRERAEKRLEKIKQQRESEGKQLGIRRAVLEAYKTKIARESARYNLEKWRTREE